MTVAVAVQNVAVAGSNVAVSVQLTFRQVEAVDGLKTQNGQISFKTAQK